MQTTAIGSARIDDEKRRWIAERLIAGVSPQSVFETLLRAGVSVPDANREINAILSSPCFAATTRLKNRLAKHDWVLDTQRRMNRLRSPEIPRVARLSTDDFFNDFYTTGRPVIITGMMEDWPACQKWSLDYFHDKFSAREVQIQFGRNADEHYEFNKLQHQKLMPFGEFIEQVRDGGKSNDIYMTANNSSHNRQALQELWQDIHSIPEYLDTSSSAHGLLWIGPEGTITPLHHDLTNIFMAQILGRKRVCIIPAWEIEHVYNHVHCFSFVDLRKIDYERFPAMRNVTILECEIGPGDLLFLPVGCWHFVEGLEVSATMSLTNFRWDNVFTERYPKQADF